MPRPIDAVDSVFIEELTWLEVRDAMRAGKTTALVASGGVEMNGPYLVTGKHNYVLRATTEAIARKLGNMLVAPIIPFVPEGQISPPTGHMRYPGTISVTESTFEALLTDIAASLKQHGFKEIYFIADSGGNVKGMKAVAERLNTQWKAKPRIHYIADYYDNAGVNKWLDSQGVHQKDEGHHDDYAITSEILTVDPKFVRLPQRITKNKASINGIPLTPLDKNVAMGRRVVDFRAQTVVNVIQTLRRK
ncbi:MAG: creatininase family protein [Bryobacterales bacterium]|nr:creatininase family protein [Bryobacterales bacterium]